MKSNNSYFFLIQSIPHRHNQAPPTFVLVPEAFHSIYDTIWNNKLAQLHFNADSRIRSHCHQCVFSVPLAGPGEIIFKRVRQTLRYLQMNVGESLELDSTLHPFTVNNPVQQNRKWV